MGRDYVKVNMTLSERFMAFFCGVIPVVAASDTPQTVSPIHNESLPIANLRVERSSIEPHIDEALDKLKELEATTRRDEKLNFFAPDTVKVKSNLGE